MEAHSNIPLEHNPTNGFRWKLILMINTCLQLLQFKGATNMCVCGKGKKCKHVTKTSKKTAKHVLLLLCPTSISHANPLIQVRIQINRPRNHFQALGQSSWLLGYHQEFCRRILLESGCALQEWPFYSWKGFHIWVKDKMARKQRFTPSNSVILAHSAHVFQSNIASFPANQKESTKKMIDHQVIPPVAGHSII